MSVIKKMRRQKAVWWERRLSSDRFGNFGFAAPIEISCRWEDVAVEFITAKGENQLSSSLVYVDRVMKPGDRLMRGELESTTPDDPMTLQSSFEIKRLDELPNFRATETLITAYL